jgi:hypothetical protein
MFSEIVIQWLLTFIPKPMASIVLQYTINLRDIETLERGFTLLLLLKRQWQSSGIRVRGASVRDLFAESFMWIRPGLTPRRSVENSIVHLAMYRAVTARLIQSSWGYISIIKARLMPNIDSSIDLYHGLTSFESINILMRIVMQHPPLYYLIPNVSERYR